jgi:hypothetical protein
MHMTRTLTAIALSTLFAAAPAFARKHTTTVAKPAAVAGDAKADAKPAEGAPAADAKPAEKPMKKTKKTTKKVEKTEKTEGAPAEGAPAK